MHNKFTRLATAFAVGLISHASATAATAWTQHQGNAAHTGYVDVRLQGDATLAWSRTVEGNVGGLAAVDGRVFVTTSGYFNGQFLHALSAQSGAELWKKDFGGIHSVNPPSVDNGVVYLQTGNHGSDSYFRGYDVVDGTLKVKTPFSAQWERYQAPAIYDGKAYVNGGYYGGAYSYDLQTGNMRWFTGLAQYDGWTPAINDRHLVAFVGGTLVELNRDTGATLQTINAPSYSWSGWTSDSAVLSGDTAYAVSSGTLTSFDLLTGTVGWSITGVSGRFAIDGDEILALRNGTVSSINATNGSINWMWEDSAVSSLGSYLIATENLIIVSGGAQTYLLDRESRKVVQTLGSSGQIALGNDQLYIGSGTSLTAYNITAVPEPGTVALLLIGLAGIGIVVRGQRATVH